MMDTSQIEDLKQAASILKTIAHPLRLGVIDLLEQHQRLSVTEICDAMQSEQSLTSHHLATMRSKGVLESQREGKNIYYKLKAKELKGVMETVKKCTIL
ncbi:MAG: ArsR/SmtB family transcription factor [Thermonemataceae bacterium]